MSFPIKPGFGVYVIFPVIGSTTAVPCFGGSIILTVLGTFLTTTKKEEQGIGEFFVLISIFINGLLFIL